MVANGGIATIGERARAPVTNPGNVIWVSAEYSGFNSGKEKKNKT